MDIPDKYLPQILGTLVRAGIARSTVGRLGGYELARPPERISLREVVETAEGPIRSQRCVLRSGPCYWGEKCAVHDAWAGGGGRTQPAPDGDDVRGPRAGGLGDRTAVGYDGAPG